MLRIATHEGGEPLEPIRLSSEKGPELLIPRPSSHLTPTDEMAPKKVAVGGYSRRVRAMIIFWISEVPPPIDMSFASRIDLSTGYSLMYP